MSATDHTQDPDLDNPPLSIERYVIVSDAEDLKDALYGFRPSFATEKEALDELPAWDRAIDRAHRVVRITTTAVEVRP